MQSGSLRKQRKIQINFKKFKEIALSKVNNSGHIDWIFDETSTYRVTIHKTEEGNLITTPINGALFTFNMNSGQLFLKVIHTSRWAGLTKRAQHSKIVASEELAALIRALPEPLHPRNIFTTRAAIVPFLKQATIDFPEIQFTPCSFFMPFQALTRLPKIRDLVDSATEPKLILFILYDDWLMEISPAMAFRRLMTLLQAFRVNNDAAQHIINPRGEPIGPERIWPKFSADEWSQIEIQLKKLIVDDFAVKHNVPATSLTEEQIEEIIYGENSSETHILQEQ